MKYLKFLLCVFVTLFCALPIFSQIPSYIPTNGLVGWWPFNGNANDESGNGNNGTINGAALTSDRNAVINSAFSFDGIDDYISFNTANLPYANSDRTISIWFLKQNNNSIWSHTALSYGSASQSNAIMISVGNNNLFTVQGWADDIGTNQPSSNSWENLIITLSSSIGNIYYNGNLITTQNVANWNTIQSVFYIGTRCDLSNSFFFGNIDDIGIWNRALTSQEISTLYNQSCNWNITPLITGSSFAYADSVYTYSVQQQNGRTYQWSTKNGGSIVGSSTNSIVQVEWDTVARDTLLVRETDTQSGCYKDTMLIVSSKFPVYYKATWVNTAPRILPNPTNGMSCYPGTPNCVGGMIDSTTNPGSRSVTFGTFNARPDTIIGINPILPTIRFQIVYRDNGSVIHDTGPLGSDRLTYDSRIGLVTCKLGPFTYDYGRELAMKVISPSGTQTTDIVSLVKANGELYIIPE